MELSDDVVLAAIQQDVGDPPFMADDLLRGTPRRLIFRATADTYEPDQALRMLQNSIDRLEARGFVEIAAPQGARSPRLDESTSFRSGRPRKLASSGKVVCGAATGEGSGGPRERVFEQSGSVSGVRAPDCGVNR